MSANDESSTPRSGGIPLPMAPADSGDRQGDGPDRRTVLKWMALAAAVPAVGASCTPDTSAGRSGAGGSGAAGDPASAAGSVSGTGIGNPKAAGTAWDPDLIRPVRTWDLVLTDDEKATLTVLCDTIIPADDISPAASTVGAVDYIDEWVSAPYDGQKADLVLVRGGLAWLDREAARRFDGARFQALGAPQITALCDEICWLQQAAPEHRMAARFFAKVRDLTATAFYTTTEGMADIGYVGNTALARWEAPPPEVLRHLGLA